MGRSLARKFSCKDWLRPLRFGLSLTQIGPNNNQVFKLTFHHNCCDYEVIVAFMYQLSLMLTATITIAGCLGLCLCLCLFVIVFVIVPSMYLLRQVLIVTMSIAGCLGARRRSTSKEGNSCGTNTALQVNSNTISYCIHT